MAFYTEAACVGRGPHAADTSPHVIEPALWACTARWSGPGRPAGCRGSLSLVSPPGTVRASRLGSAGNTNGSLTRGRDWLRAPRVGEGGRVLLGRCRCLGTRGVWTGPAWELGFCCSGGNAWVLGWGIGIVCGQRNGGRRLVAWCRQGVAAWLRDTWQAVIGGGAVDKARQSKAEG